jgi:hypothetical protein
MGLVGLSEAKKKQGDERKRLKKAGLRVMCIHIPHKIYRAFKIKVARDRVTIRAVVLAMIELYIQGGFNVEEEKNQADKK